MAEALYTRAIRAADESAGAVDPRLVIGLLLGHAESLIELGRHREATGPAGRARRLAADTGDEPLQARALLTLGRIESDVGDDRVARQLLSQALVAFESGTSAGRPGPTTDCRRPGNARTTAGSCSTCAWRTGLFERAGDRWGCAVAAQDLAYLLTTIGGEEFHHWYQRAHGHVEGESDLRSRAAILRAWGYFSYYCGAHREAIRAVREARPVAIEAGHRYAELDTFLIEAMAASCVASFREAEQLAAEVVRMGKAIGSTRVAGLGLAVGARASLRAGNPARAGRRLSLARRTLRQSGARMELLEVDFIDAGIQLDRGNWQRVAGPASRGAAGVRASGWALYGAMEPLLVGRALLGAGSPGGAVGELRRAAKLAREVGATGTLALAAVALDQALILTGGRAARPPSGPRPTSRWRRSRPRTTAWSRSWTDAPPRRRPPSPSPSSDGSSWAARPGWRGLFRSKRRRPVMPAIRAGQAGWAPGPTASSTRSRPQPATAQASARQSRPERSACGSRSKARARSSTLGAASTHGTWRSLASASALGTARTMRGAKRRSRRIGATVPHRIRWCLKPAGRWCDATAGGGLLPVGWLPRLGPSAPTGPQGVGLGPLRKPVGVLALQLEHALSMVEERLAAAVEEGLLAGRVQVAELALQRLVLQPMRIEAELPRHGSPLHPAAGRRRGLLPTYSVASDRTPAHNIVGHTRRTAQPVCWSTLPSAYRALGPPARIGGSAGEPGRKRDSSGEDGSILTMDRRPSTVLSHISAGPASP
jgi:tetratricopeptide (TPR) repeat protein